MKLAEALLLRANYQKKLSDLKNRLTQNAKVQEGDSPSESPQELIEDLESTSGQLESIIQKINRTNSNTVVSDDKTIADKLATRDVMLLKYSAYKNLAQTATITQDRYSKSEVKFKSTVKVSEIQKQADALSKQYRELDAKIQQLNWSTELME